MTSNSDFVYFGSAAPVWFHRFFAAVKNSSYGVQMLNTVEDSPWHREANVLVHTQMCISEYLKQISAMRSARQNAVALIALTCHDFGKPEAEETLERKDGTGTYRRYAGHESISANEFTNFLIDNKQVTQDLLDAGITWDDLLCARLIIEHHLPFGLVKPQKRIALKTALASMLGDELLETFYDHLVSDCAGRISDDHETKKQAVTDWVNEFRTVPVQKIKAAAETAPVLYVLIGPSGAGKSTWVKKNLANAVVVSEDDYRLTFAAQHMDRTDQLKIAESTDAEVYDLSWKFCHLSEFSTSYDQFVRSKVQEAVSQHRTTVIDRTNTTRKSRRRFMTPFMTAGYKLCAVLFVTSENTVNARQITRGDKCVAAKFVHQHVMSTELPWVDVEFHDVKVVLP